MIKKVIPLVVLISIFLLSGCASVKMASKEEDSATKNFTRPSSDKAGLYIYRNSTIGSSVKKELYVDNVLIGETANGVYFYLEIVPGTHNISTESEFGENSVSFQAEGGKNYFAEQYMKMGIFIAGSGIEMVDESVGMKEVLDCNLAERQK